MKKLFYSELTKKYYDSAEDCLKAERVYNEEHEAEIKKKEERAARAKEVENALLAEQEAHKKYIELRNKFIEDYKSYHCSYSTVEELPQVSFADLFDTLNKFWF